MISKRIFHVFTFQPYMFNRESLEHCGINALDEVLALKIANGFYKVFIETQNYIDEDIIKKAIKGYKLSAYRCLGGEGVLEQPQKNLLHYMNKNKTFFVTANEGSGKLIYLKGKSKYFIEKKKKINT